MKILRRLLLLTLLATLAGAAWNYRDPLISLYNSHFGAKRSAKDKIKPDPKTYEKLRGDLEMRRTVLAQRYARARTPREISNVIIEAQNVLETTLPKMMRCWLGTKYDFNGHCKKPGSGTIACGYFVSTVLQDAGFRVERYKLGQQPSQNIIRTFLPRENMHIRSGLSYKKFLDEVIARGPGIRIVGLDTHAAFLIVPQEGDIRFIHASGGPPQCVVDEDRYNADALRASKYRVTGNLTRSADLIHNWLTGADWPTKE